VQIEVNIATNLPEIFIEIHSNLLNVKSWNLQENWLDVAEEIDDMFLGDAEVE